MGVKDAFLSRLLGSASSFSREQLAQTVDLILEHALSHGASDIHIEPHGQVVWVRYRIHGTLHGLHKLPLAALLPLINALKKEAKLEHPEGTPGEIAFTHTVKGAPLELRLNTMPVVGGERAVLHIAGRAHPVPSDLAAIGFWGSNADLVRATLARVHGLILVSGNKRSHLPATLYSLLQLLKTAPISITTIEETVEQHIPGLNQTRLGTHSAKAYADALQAALRQDTNVIMLDRIPGKEIAATSLYASTAGHMVIGGLHCDTAAKAVLYIKHMGVEPFVLASALRLSIAQRAVRLLCLSCREQVTPPAALVNRIEQIFGMRTPATRKRIHILEAQAQAAGVGGNTPLSTVGGRLTSLWQAKPGGCEHCHFTGYQGTINLVEVLPGGDYLFKHLDDSAADLQVAALKEGFIPLALDGIIKALRGETTITEVIREVGHD